MKIISIISLISLSILSYSQDKDQLIRIHNISNLSSLSTISNPLEGNLIYVNSEDKLYMRTNNEWVPLDNYWSITGNSITDTTQFIGTTTAHDFLIKTSGSERMSIRSNGYVGVSNSLPSGQFQVGTNSFFVDPANGRVGLGTVNPLHALHVNGNVLARSYTVADYVFQYYFDGKSNLNKNYRFLSLEEVEEFVQKHHHLPNVTSAKEVEKQGGVMLNKATEENLEKIEELHLYLIELNQKALKLDSLLNQ